MSIKLDWHEGDDQPDVTWESDTASPLAEASAQTLVRGQAARSRLPGRFWRVLLLVMLVPLAAAALAFGWIKWQAGRGAEQARQDIEATAQLLIEARHAQDEQLVASLLDPLDTIWRQARLNDSQTPPVIVQVQSVELDNNKAVAETLETYADGETLRKLAFFRRQPGDQQWRLAPPWPDAFGPEQRSESNHFRIHYRERDQALISDLTNLAEGAFVTLCGELACRPGNRPLSLQILYSSTSLPEKRWGDLVIESPLLLGLDENDRPGPALQPAIVAEMATYLARQTAPAASDALLQALAGWAVADLTGASSPIDEVQAAARSDSLVPLARAWSDIAILDKADDPLALAEISSFLLYLQQTHGSDAVGRLLAELPNSQSLDALLPRALGSDPALAQDRWLAWLGLQRLTPPGSQSS